VIVSSIVVTGLADRKPRSQPDEDDRLQPSRRRAYLFNVDETPGRLNLGLDADMARRQAGVRSTWVRRRSDATMSEPVATWGASPRRGEGQIRSRRRSRRVGHGVSHAFTPETQHASSQSSVRIALATLAREATFSSARRVPRGREREVGRRGRRLGEEALGRAGVGETGRRGSARRTIRHAPSLFSTPHCRTRVRITANISDGHGRWSGFRNFSITRACTGTRTTSSLNP